MELDFDKSQLTKGQVVVQDINNSIDSFEKDLDNAIKEIKNAAKAYKVNLGDTIVVSGLQDDFKNMRNDLIAINELSEKQFDLAEKYEKGALDEAALQFGVTVDQYFRDEAFKLSNYTNPDEVTKVGATIGMGVFKFGEGFLEFFEDIGDCAITIGAGAASIFGARDTAKSWKDFAKQDLAVNLVENNKAFEWINKNSYFDKDSTFATAFKIGGKATGALVTGKVLSSAYIAHTSRAADVLVSADKVSKVSKRATEVSNILSTQGANVTSNLKSGQGIRSALLYGTIASGVGLGLTKGVSNPVGEKIGEKMANTPVKEVVQKVDEKATDVFGSEAKDAVGKLSQSAVNTSVSTGKKETTGNLISGDGNEKSLEDEEAKYAANTGIDATKKAGEKTLEKSLGSAGEKTLEQTAEKVGEKAIEKTGTKIVEETIVKSVL